MDFQATYNLLIAFIMPVVLYVVVFLTLILVQFRKKNRNKKIYKRLIIAFIIINISIQPFLVKEGFSGLDCITLYSNKNFLVYDLSMECYTDEHYKLV